MSCTAVQTETRAIAVTATFVIICAVSGVLALNYVFGLSRSSIEDERFKDRWFDNCISYEPEYKCELLWNEMNR